MNRFQNSHHTYIGIRRGTALFAFACMGAMLSLSRPASAQLDPPHGHVPFLTLFAEGVQIYQSAFDPNQSGAFVWQFTAPQADLFTDATKNVYFGSHFAGPTWKAEQDGSEVRGTVLVRQASPHPNSIPELLLAASSHSGAGIFEDVTYIQRLDTVGGMAPSTLPTNIEDTFRSPYTATYRFFEVQAVPEPGTVACGLGLVAAGSLLYRRKRAHRRAR